MPYLTGRAVCVARSQVTALKACAEMATLMGDTKSASLYRCVCVRV